MLLALTGIAVGLAVGLALSRWLASLLYGVTPTNLATYSMVCELMLMVAAAACYLPARRATRIQPTEALRGE